MKGKGRETVAAAERERLPSNEEWRRWGKEDPLWSVAAWEGKSRTGPNPWTDEQFYALGRSDWQDFRMVWNTFGFQFNTVLEIGCGAGRFTASLAEEFSEVIAVDVSEDMINYARGRIVGSNVKFVRTDGVGLPAANESVSAVFSAHVLQHLDRREHALPIFAEAHRVLEGGGTAFVHLPVVFWPPGFSVRSIEYRLYVWRERLRRVRASLDRRRGKRLMRMVGYEYHWLYASLQRIGFTEIQMRVVRPRSNDDPHAVVMMRKPA